VNGHTFCADFFQDNKVIEIPVKNARQAQLIEFVDIEFNRASAEIKTLGDLHHAREADSLQRNGVSAAHRHQIDMVTVKSGHHREAGKAAFCRLDLQDHRQFAANAE